MSESSSRAGRPGRIAAIYARVSSDRQRREQTIQSQTAALRELAAGRGLLVPEDLVFEDEGVSGAVLRRPELEFSATRRTPVRPHMARRTRPASRSGRRATHAGAGNAPPGSRASTSAPRSGSRSRCPRS